MDAGKSLSPRGKSSVEEAFYKFEGSTLTGPFPKGRDNFTSLVEPLMHRELLNDSEYAQWCNLTFITRGERVNSLRAIIEVRCPELLMVVSIIKKKKEKKTGQLTIEFKDDSYMSKFVLQNLLDWAYTGSISFSELTMSDVQVVLLAAEKLGMTHLTWQCNNYIRQYLTRETAFAVLKQADLIQLQSIRDLALGYCKENWIQILQNKGGSGSEVLGLGLFQELTIAVQVGGDKPLTIPSQAEEPFNTLEGDFAKILETEAFADGEVQFGGTTLRFHKAIVAAHTKAMQKFLGSNKGKVVSFNGLSEVAVKNMLEFIYFGQKKFNAIGSVTLVEHAIAQYELNSMSPYIVAALKNGIAVETALPILRITYLPASKELNDDTVRDKALACICENFPRIDVPAIKNLEPGNQDVGFTILTDVLEALHAFSKGSLPAAAGTPSKKKAKKKVSKDDSLLLDMKKSSSNSSSGSRPKSARGSRATDEVKQKGSRAKK